MVPWWEGLTGSGGEGVKGGRRRKKRQKHAIDASVGFKTNVRILL